MDESAWPTSGLTADAHRDRGKEDRHTVHPINRDSHHCTEQGLPKEPLLWLELASLTSLQAWYLSALMSISTTRLWWLLAAIARAVFPCYIKKRGRGVDIAREMGAPASQHRPAPRSQLCHLLVN